MQPVSGHVFHVSLVSTAALLTRELPTDYASHFDSNKDYSSEIRCDSVNHITFFPAYNFASDSITQTSVFASVSRIIYSQSPIIGGLVAVRIGSYRPYFGNDFGQRSIAQRTKHEQIMRVSIGAEPSITDRLLLSLLFCRSLRNTGWPDHSGTRGGRGFILSFADGYSGTLGSLTTPEHGMVAALFFPSPTATQEHWVA